MLNKSLIKSKLANICKLNESIDGEAAIVNKAGCKLCECVFREEAESLYEKGKRKRVKCNFWY